MTPRLLAPLVLAASVLGAVPAFATGEISCGNGNGASIDLLVGHLDVLSISRAVITVGDKVWSSTPESWPGMPITVGQAFEDDGQLLVDITDENVNEVMARLRAVKLTEGDTTVTAGVLSLKGEGVWAVDCSEAE
jgi:hypothetical protein